MKKLFIKPAVAGLIIRNPKNPKQIITDKGAWVVDDVHWQREILQGSIIVCSEDDASNVFDKSVNTTILVKPRQKLRQPKKRMNKYGSI